MNSDKHRLASKTTGESLADGFRLFFRNYGILIIIFALFYIITILLKTFLLTDLMWVSHLFDQDLDRIYEKYDEDIYNATENELDFMMRALLLQILVLILDLMIGAVFSVIAMCLVSGYLYKEYVNENPNFAEEVKKAFNPKLIKVVLLIGVLMPLSTVLYIPTLLIFGFFINYIITYNMDDEIEKPLSAAKSISSFWMNILIFIICFAINLGISIGSGMIFYYTWNIDSVTYWSWVDPASRNYGMLFLDNLVYAIPDIIISPLFICLLVSVFASKKARWDLGYYQPPQRAYTSPHAAQQPYTSPSTYTSTPAPQPGNALYCPFCGYHIADPRKHCPNCGESIEFD